MKKAEDYEKEIKDVDEVEGQDLKLNPDYYIHNALLKAQNTLVDKDLKEALVRYRLYIDHIETLCNAADMLVDRYHDKCKEYLEANPLKNNDEKIWHAKFANKRLGWMMKEVFESKGIKSALRIRKEL